MVDPAVVKSVRNYLGNLIHIGFKISFAVVFGSQSTGKTHQWSDIDVIVVSSQFDESINRMEINKLWRVAARTDNRIEPVPCGERQWIEDDSSAVIEIARREGTRIDLL